MGHEESVHSLQGKREAIGTYGLLGCTAIAVIMENKNDIKDRTAIVAHYSPIEFSSNTKRLRSLIVESKKEGLNAKAIILSPGEYHQNPETGKYKMEPKKDEESRIGLIYSMLKVDFGEEIEIHTFGYNENQMIGSHGQGTMLIEFPKDLDEETKIYVENVSLDRKIGVIELFMWLKQLILTYI